MPVTEDPPCQLEACAIQTCLSQHSYQEDKCQDVLKKLYKCCEIMYDQKKGPSSACAKESLVRLKLKQMK